MIRYKIKVKNDHYSFTESFEAETLILDPNDPDLKRQVEEVIKKFNAPVERVTISAKLEE